MSPSEQTSCIFIAIACASSALLTFDVFAAGQAVQATSLTASSTPAMVKSTLSDGITLEEYSRYLTDKMKKDMQPKGDQHIGLVVPQKAVKIDPTVGWRWNGTLTGGQIQAGEILIDGRSQLVYMGDVLRYGWIVTELSPDYAVLYRKGCETKVTGRKKAAATPKSEACTKRISREAT